MSRIWFCVKEDKMTLRREDYINLKIKVACSFFTLVGKQYAALMNEEFLNVFIFYKIYLFDIS